MNKDHLSKSRFFSMLSVVLKNLRKSGSTTLRYPVESVPIPKGFRGVPQLNENCTACNQCVQDCPSQCIKISDDWEYDVNGAEFKVMYINLFQCIYCGSCEDSCPNKAIFMTDNWITSTPNKDAMFYQYKIIRR